MRPCDDLNRFGRDAERQEFFLRTRPKEGESGYDCVDFVYSGDLSREKDIDRFVHRGLLRREQRHELAAFHAVNKGHLERPVPLPERTEERPAIDLKGVA